MNAPNLLTAIEAVRLVKADELQGPALAEACYRQIERLNPELNAFITVMPPSAEATTRGPSGRWRESDLLPAIPVAVKDLIETAGVPTTAGSLFFKDNIPSADAAIITRIREVGGTILGKTNTHEIALGVTTANPHFGTCRNPWDRARIPGGSSGGSAVAVATGMALVALGTDTGGSIRIPASLCGVVGLKPTYGRVSLRGIVPLSWNLDHAGPLTRCVEDAALMLQVIAGYDPEYAWSANVGVDDYSAEINDGVGGWRIALAKGAYVEAADSAVLEALHEVGEVLRKIGAKVEPVDVSFLREAALANGLMTQADGAAYHRERLAEHPDWFGHDVRQRLETGRDLKSGDYVIARRTQAVTRHRLDRLFDDHDILLLPSTPTAAPPIQGEDAVEEARRLTRFTAPFNLSGLPAISIPCGLSHEGLPLGCQMVSPAWREAALLRAARAYERETDWAQRRPPGT